MPLTPGTSLGPYAVTAKIGEGGMGEVCRARDTKLDRDVALKVGQRNDDDLNNMNRLHRSGKTSHAAVLAAAMAISMVGFGAPAMAQDQTIEQHTAAARALAEKDITGVVASAADSCPGAHGNFQSSRIYSEHFSPVPPTRVFDNLSFVGDEFVGAWVLETDDGLILFDAFSSGVEASRYVTGDLRQLGLDPTEITYVVITHGHWDHFGGAGFLQTEYGARVVMGEADWDAVATADPWGTELEGQVPPRRDIAVTKEPMDLTLGDTTVKLFLTPGHSPGTVSALIPARDGTRTHWLAMWGGNAIPRNLEPIDPNDTAVWRNLGVRRMNQSLRDFRDWVVDNGGDGVISTHTNTAATLTRLAALRNRSGDEPHPFVVGEELTRAYFDAMDHCMQALTIQAKSRR